MLGKEITPTTQQCILDVFIAHQAQSKTMALIISKVQKLLEKTISQFNDIDSLLEDVHEDSDAMEEARTGVFKIRSFLVKIG